MKTRILLIVVALFAVGEARAFNFTPTDAEWASWPGYCRAKYAWTQIGRRSKFAHMVSEADVVQLRSWESAGMTGLHHYCAGMLYLNRALLEEDRYRRDGMLRNALDETQFTFNSANPGSPRFSFVVVQLAAIFFEQGDTELAIQTLRRGIQTQPKSGMLYSAKAVMEKRAGRLEEAYQTLLDGNEAVDGASAEILYNLGLISLELGRVDEARQYADLAYSMGFPLQGLRSKLQRAE